MANSTERIGVYHCGLIAEQNNWLFREQPINDIGIDAHMEFIDSLNKPKQLLALQIKTGESWFKESDEDYVVFRKIDERQYCYWTMNSLPCIVVLYNPSDGMCIWQELSKNTIQKTKDGSGKGYFVKVPKKQLFLDALSNKKLLEITNLPERVVNYNFLLSQKEFMKIIDNGGIVKLHSTEWVNKSSGRGTIELIVEDDNGTKTIPYPYWFPFTPYTMVFEKLFPWANFSADEEFFEDEDESAWRESECYYDSEEDEYIQVGDSFSEFREGLSPMRSINHSGEVAEYMMILSINDLGYSFLMVDDFVNQSQPYSKARPDYDDED